MGPINPGRGSQLMYACAEQAEHIARAISNSLTFEKASGLITFTSFHVPCHMTHEGVGLLGAG